MTCHKRYKIQKKVREHNRKVRKAAKKRGHKKPKKDLGVPNSAPFKDEVLREAEQRKQMREELKQKRKLDRQKEFQKKREQETNKKNENKIKDPEKELPAKQKGNSTKPLDKNSKRFFCKELKEVIDASDVVLEVLDARDPLGCRCPQLEQLVTQSDGGKKLLLVLNKIDLIPKENLEKWLNYLNNELPTIAFKSATQLRDRNMQKKYIKRRGTSVTFSRANLCFGRDCLLKHLQEHSVTKGKVIHVGVIGFPSVGKSSVINSLKEMRACNVGPLRGLTKSMQVVHIDKQIKMLDSPSIIVSPSSSAVALALRSTMNFRPENAVDSVDIILTHFSKPQIILHYNIPDYRNSLEFLSLLSQKKGLLKKGGLANTTGTAESLLSDWTGAKVRYYSEPPESWNMSPHLSIEAVAATKQDFDMEDLAEDNKTTIKAIKYPNQASSIFFQSPGFTDGVIEASELSEAILEQESMEASEDEEELTEQEGDEEESDMDNAEEESNRPVSSTTTSEVLEAKNANWGKSLTGKEINIDKTADLDDAYDFNTDYI
ncbi:guanine nucleotide-binding protein-like 3 isoform X2 [Tiliqua scincoides]